MARSLLQWLFPADLHHVAGLQKEIRARLPDLGRVLDLGCGSNADLAPYRSPGREVWGTDFQTHSELRHAEWFRPLGPDGRIPFPDGWFDAVVSIMVLEHVADPPSFFAEVGRILRPGGVFIGHTISGAHYVTVIRRLIGLLPHSFNQALVHRLYGRPCEDTFPAYYRLNRERQIDRASRPCGLTRVGLERYADPHYFGFSRVLKGAATLADWSLEKLGAGRGRLYFTVTLRKDGDPVASGRARVA